MLCVTLEYRDSIPLECPDLVPDRLAMMSLAEISRLELWQGNQKLKLGDLATLSGTPTDGVVRLLGDWGKVKWLGKGMSGGCLEIMGDCGMHTGSAMKGGKLLVWGNASDWAGGEMRGGLLDIRGSAGHSLGAGYPGARSGMRGGTILVGGDCGGETGAVMRRGLIVVRGKAGPFVGAGMIAGNLVFGKGCGIRPGAAMKRGSILCGAAPDSVLPSFSEPRKDSAVWIALLRAHGCEAGFPEWETLLPWDGPWMVTRGDRVSLGMGELIWPA